LKGREHSRRRDAPGETAPLDCRGHPRKTRGGSVEEDGGGAWTRDATLGTPAGGDRLNDDQRPTLDEIGEWSRIKLEIVREYSAAFSKILARQPNLQHIYIDGFAGAGLHLAKGSGEEIPCSPLQVLGVTPPFREYHFVEMNSERLAFLKRQVGDRSNVFFHPGDCNQLVPKIIAERAKYQDYRRALCLLDPYGLHLHWNVIAAAGVAKSVDLLLNFPLMDMNMNALRWDPDSVTSVQADRMSAYWGDESWRQAAYRKQPGLFGDIEEKQLNEVVAEAFRERLRTTGCFPCVPSPLPMRNGTRATVYYLFFGSQKPVAEKIMKYILKKNDQLGGA